MLCTTLLGLFPPSARPHVCISPTTISVHMDSQRAGLFPQCLSSALWAPICALGHTRDPVAWGGRGSRGQRWQCCPLQMLPMRAQCQCQQPGLGSCRTGLVALEDGFGCCACCFGCSSICPLSRSCCGRGWEEAFQGRQKGMAERDGCWKWTC